MTLNPFTHAIPKPAARGTITLTGEEYDAVKQRARVLALEEAASVAAALVGHISPEVPIDWDNGAEELGWDQACKDIDAGIRALIERERT